MRYTIDPDDASITVTGSSSLHPIVAVAPARGWVEAQIVDGQFVPNSALTGLLEVEIEDLKSGNPLIDRETKRRLKTEDHPLIVAAITDTRRVSANSAAISGTITFFGETVDAAGRINLTMGPTLVGEGNFDVRTWGLQPPRLLTVRVHPELSVRVDLPLH